MDRYREVCTQCLRPLSHCLCECIRPFDTRTRFVFLIHPKEVKRTRNGTGRLAHLALNNSEIIMGIDFSKEPRVQTLLADKRYFPCILYPGKSSAAPSEFLAGLSAEFDDDLKRREKSLLIFVIDGTWTAAKKMMKLSRNLHDLARIALDPGQPSRFVIKQQPNPQCLSTIESLHTLLSEFEKHGLENLGGQHQNLMVVLDKMVKTQLAYINDPTIPGYRREKDSTPVPRARSKKHRKLFPFFH
jgi:DTW domain-containing protein YfiP